MVTIWTQSVFNVKWLQEHWGLYLDQWPRYPPRQFPDSGLRVVANAGCLDLSLQAVKQQDQMDPTDLSFYEPMIMLFRVIPADEVHNSISVGDMPRAGNTPKETEVAKAARISRWCTVSGNFRFLLQRMVSGMFLTAPDIHCYHAFTDDWNEVRRWFHECNLRVLAPQYAFAQPGPNQIRENIFE